jgi:PAS domain S-box-containing protein
MSLRDADRIAAGARMTASPPAGPGLQRLLDLAAALLGAPTAGVALAGELQTIAGVSGTSVWAVGEQHPLGDTLGGTVVDARAPRAYRDVRTDPRVAGLPSVQAGRVGGYLGVPLVEASGEHVVGVLAVFGPEPRDWTDADVVSLTRLAGPVVSELELAVVTAELRSARVRGDLAIAAAGIGIFDWDVVADRLDWDDQMLELLGYDRSDFPGTSRALYDRLHPDDVTRVSSVIGAAVGQGSDFTLDYRAVLPSGELRWMSSRGRALRDDSGTTVRVLGAVQDTTRRRHEDARVARVLETMPTAFYSLDSEWRFSHVNAQAERLVGRTREDLLGGVVWDLFPAARGSVIESEYRAAVASGRERVFEAHYPAPLDTWFEVRAWPGTDGLSVYFLDVTERRQVQEGLRREAERLALVGRVSDTLSTALAERRGSAGALEELARAVVPVLGDWVIASLVEDSGRLSDVASWHRDPELRETAARYARLRLGALTNTAPIVSALATGEVVSVPDVAAAVGHRLPAGEVRDAYWVLDPGTAETLALVARGRVLGAMSLYRDRGRAPMDAAERALFREVADRVAVALDGAALHEQQRRMAEDLQRSLLTAPPEPDHREIAVRYVPAVQAAQVGGDWYDAFRQAGGATVLAIGDVVGHDTAAAAAMGQLRSLLRGIAYSSGGGPAAVLSDLDRAMEGLQVRTLATAAVARLEQTAEEHAQGLTRLRWSSAGHPPLLVRHPDGRVEVLATERADLLLGVAPERPRREQVVVLERGATVLMYTDGLVEAPDLLLDDGVARLQELLGELGGLPLEELCDELLGRMRPGGSEDDVALVAVRPHPEDRPRPPGTGPGATPPGP